MAFDERLDGWFVAISRGIQLHHTSYAETDPKLIIKRIVKSWGETGMGKVHRITLSPKITKVYVPDKAAETGLETIVTEQGVRIVVGTGKPVPGGGSLG